FLDIVYAGDLDPLAKDAVFTAVPCSRTPPPASITPPCSPSMAEGEPVRLIPFASCQPNGIMTRQLLRDALGGTQRTPLFLHAVYTASVPFSPQPDAAFAVAMSDARGSPINFYLNMQGSLVGQVTCGGGEPSGSTGLVFG